MGFNLSITKPLEYVPWRYTVAPTYASDGSQLTPGTKETLTGVFVMVDEKLITALRAKLTTNTQRTQFDSWIFRITAAEAANSNFVMWSGDTSAVFLRISATIWAKWNDPVPAIIKTRFAHLHLEDIY